MKQEDRARRQAIVNGPQAQVTLEEVLAQQPIGAIRVHQITQVLTLPASPLAGLPMTEPSFGDVELHVVTLGDTDRQIIPLLLNGAKHLHQALGQSIDRVERKLAGETPEEAPTEEAPSE